MEFLRQRIGLIARCCISGGILIYLGCKVDWPKLWHITRTSDLFWLGLAWIISIPWILLTAERWRVLLRVQHIHIPFRRALEVSLIGQFFNVFLLGVTGGDVMKIYYATRLAPEKKAAAGLSVMMDRIAGLAALLFIAVAFSWNSRSFFYQNAQAAAAFSATALIALAAFSLVLLGLVYPIIRKNNWVRRQVSSIPLLSRLASLEEALFIYLHHWKGTFAAVLIAAVMHTLNFLIYFCVLKALHLSAPFFIFISILPVIGCVMAIPISISGFGVREGLSILFLGMLGISQEASLAWSLIAFVMILFWAMVGGVIYLGYRHPAETSH